MNKKKNLKKQKPSSYLSLFFVASAVITLLVTAVFMVKTRGFNQKNKKTITVAIFAAVDIPAMQRLMKGMKDFVSSQHPECSFTTYFYNMDRQLLKAQVEEAINKQYDILFTIGSGASQTAYKMTQTRESPIPVIFSSIYDPIGNGLALGDYQGKPNTTGTAVLISDDAGKLDYLLKIKPEIERAVIVYNPSDSNLEICKNSLRRDLVHRNITVQVLEIFQGDNIKAKSNGTITEKTDAVFILRDYFTIRSLSAIKKVCESFSVALFAQDSYSVEQGAVAAYCPDDYGSGLISGEIVCKVLQSDQPADTIPITYLEIPAMEKLMVNPFSLKKQGITTPLDQIAALSRVEFRGQPSV